MAIRSGVTIGAPTGGDKGAGTLNAVTVYGNNVVLTSDAGLKRGIRELPACLPLVEAVAPKSYRWRPLEKPEEGPDDFAERRRWGFLAQDFDGPTRTDAAGEAGIDAGALNEMGSRSPALPARRPPATPVVAETTASAQSR